MLCMMGFPNFFPAFVSSALCVVPLTEEVVSKQPFGRMPYSFEELEEVTQRAIHGYHLPLEYLFEHIGKYAYSQGMMEGRGGSSP